MTGAQIAILVRLTAQTPPIEQALIAADIPYRVAGEEPFFRRREVVDLLKYAELAAYDAALRAGQRLDGAQGEQFAACWRSLYNRPKRYLTRQFLQETTSAVLCQGQPLSEVLVELTDKVAERLADTLHDLADLLRWFAEARLQLSAEALLRELDWRLGYQDFLIRNSGFAETGAGYAANVAAFIQHTRGKGTLAELAIHLAELEAERTVLDAGDPHVVDIRSIHKAKGLEWPVVLIPNCNAGIIPVGSATDVEEERRLLYVAIARAKQRLYLYAATGEAQLSPFLAAASVDATLGRAAEVQRLLTTDPLAWTAAEALSLLTFPRQYGQERCFTPWWAAPPEAQGRVAGRLLALVQAITARDAASQLGVTDADVQLWHSLAPEPDAALEAPFPGIDALCPPRGARVAGPDGAVPLPGRQPPPGAPPPDYRVGELVQHPQFGQGVVVAVDAGKTGRAIEWFITVEFRSRGWVCSKASGIMVSTSIARIASAATAVVAAITLSENRLKIT